MRDLLFKLGLDKERFEQKDWNPFGDFIRKRNTAVVKLNFVVDYYPYDNRMACGVAHGPIIRTVPDNITIALQNKGKIIMPSPVHRL